MLCSNMLVGISVPVHKIMAEGRYRMGYVGVSQISRGWIQWKLAMIIQRDIRLCWRVLNEVAGITINKKDSYSVSW